MIRGLNPSLAPRCPCKAGTGGFLQYDKLVLNIYARPSFCPRRFLEKGFKRKGEMRLCLVRNSEHRCVVFFVFRDVLKKCPGQNVCISEIFYSAGVFPKMSYIENWSYRISYVIPSFSLIGVRYCPYGICCPWVRGGWDLDDLGKFFRRRRRPRPHH